ncbi:non-specific serine/threonine protein kinase [Dissoconium aciculare CBS 342.82]|uniref:non-specific serine/threonine protein kinase n=1 Tax=Dissoconium aciculare CBS 342.82 TaxID=1314786 RepID=A0A6J3LZT8_9PEZI|nr:non-specific serine/threonine protein kinase [Dissoconium aciculare CBS 342.82]KAF1821305.1 non-specific serine/threonine protein kinase [Dissoconium aciculare CBS 342.82]
MSGSSLTEPFEEEQLSWYKADRFYPVHIGEILNAKYKVIGKLGWGAYFTTWLCRNILDSSFTAVKVGTRDVDRPKSFDREVKFYERVNSLATDHAGSACIRGLHEVFKLSGPTGDHLCLVQPPMHMTMRELQQRNSSRRLNEQLLKWTLFNLLHALSFLHDEVGAVHTDISPSNIMFTISDESLLTEFERAEAEDPSPVKVIDSVRSIYASRKFGLPKDLLWGQPVLCDFGETRLGLLHKGPIQSDLYRAPEVLFDMEWTTSVDIWSVATLAWDLFENRQLFHALNAKNQTSATRHIAETVAYLGCPPLEYIQRSPITSKVFDERGSWRGAGNTSIPPITLEQAEIVLEGRSKEEFLAFIRSMLKWLPEERLTAADLLKHSWMIDAIPKSE